MDQLGLIILGVAVLAFFFWLMKPSVVPGKTDSSGDPFIDPDDSYQIGLLAGLTDHSIPDAAVMRFALQRFQEVHGRRATSRDIGIVLGMVHTME
jgi:hypothetical protein